MAVTRESTTELRTLRALCSGKIVSPDDPGYDEARHAWNLAADQRPAAVAFPENESDVAFALAYAREAGLRVNVQGTGHNPMPLGDMSGMLLIRTSEMKRVEIDAEARIARVHGSPPSSYPGSSGLTILPLHSARRVRSSLVDSRVTAISFLLVEVLEAHHRRRTLQARCGGVAGVALRACL